MAPIELLPVHALEAKKEGLLICFYVYDGVTQAHVGCGPTPLEPRRVRAHLFLRGGQRGEVANRLVYEGDVRDIGDGVL